MPIGECFLTGDASSCLLPSFSTGTPSGLNLCWPCAQCHSLCELILHQPCCVWKTHFLGVNHPLWLLQSFYFLFLIAPRTPIAGLYPQIFPTELSYCAACWDTDWLLTWPWEGNYIFTEFMSVMTMSWCLEFSGSLTGNPKSSTYSLSIHFFSIQKRN